jgi:acyl-coenzyme A synthetase/AMP-(fatty) acid ligase
MYFDCWLINTFANLADKKAIIFKDATYTYSNLYEQIVYYVELLKTKTVTPGSIVAINSDYSFEVISLFFALTENKNIIVPISTTVLTEIDRRLESVGVDYVFDFQNDTPVFTDLHGNDSKHALLRQLVASGKPGLVLFSSGSTGEPKAMLHDLKALIGSYGGKKQKKINTMIFLTFDHIGGIDTMLRLLSIGGTLTIPLSRQPEDICRSIQKYKVDVLPSSPTFLNLMLLSGIYRKYDLSSLKIIAFGAEPMPESLLLRLKALFSDVDFQQKFGTSETNAIRINNMSGNSLFFRFDDPNLEYKIVNDELWLKSKTKILGYLNAPMDSFTEDGWFKTGDLVEMADNGYIKIVGRDKEVINVGGEKVLPAEVESVLLEMNEFSDVMVYGEQNQITGQIVVADVVLKKEMGRREVKKIVRKFCKSRLEHYKIPTKVVIVEKTNYGDRFKKIRRK